MSADEEWWALPTELRARIVNLQGSAEELFRYDKRIPNMRFYHDNQVLTDFECQDGALSQK
jgi:hypothetical protein